MKNIKRRAVKLATSLTTAAILCITSLPVTLFGVPGGQVFADNSSTLEAASVAIDGWTYGEDPNEPTVNNIYPISSASYNYYVGTVEDESGLSSATPTSDENGAESSGGVPAYPGEYTVVATYSMQPMTAAIHLFKTFEIGKADLSVKSDVDWDKEYDGTTGTSTSDYIEGIVDGDNIVFKAEYEDKNVGADKNISITVDEEASDDVLDRYNGTDSLAATGTISPKKLLVTGITVSDKTYNNTTDATVDISNATINPSQVISGDEVALDLSSSSTNVTGTFDASTVGQNIHVTLSGTIALSGASAANYEVELEDNLTANIITQEGYSVSLNKTSFTYTGAAIEPAVKVTYKATPEATGEELANDKYAVTYSNNVNAGSAQVRIVGNAEHPGLNITETFTIAPAPIIITAKNATKVFGTDDPTLTYEVTGLLGSDTKESIGLTGKLTRDAGENVGSYTIKSSFSLPEGNYTIETYKPATLTITKISHKDVTLDEVSVTANSSSSVSKTVDISNNLVSGGTLKTSSVSGDLDISVGELSDGKVTFTFKNPKPSTTGKAALVIVSNNYENYTITVPFKTSSTDSKPVSKSSVGITSTSAYTSVSNVTTNGLQEYANKTAGSDVNLSFTAKTSGDLDGTVKDRIMSAIKSTFSAFKDSDVKVEFFDLTIKQTISSTTNTISDLGEPIEIILSMTLSDKNNVVVFRDHGGQSVKFAALSSRPSAGSYTDASYFVDKDNGKLYIYSRYFSIYSVAYTGTNVAESDTLKTTTATATAPKTGDNSLPIAVWVCAALIGILMVVCIVREVRKNRDDDTANEDDAFEDNEDIDEDDEVAENSEE